MPKPWAAPETQYVGQDRPIALRPDTYQRHSAAADYVLGTNRARYPRPGRGRTTSPTAGAWAILASGDSISAISGLTLGSGAVELAERDGANLTGTGEMLMAYNAGPEITAEYGDRIIKLTWTDGVWSAARCG